MSLREGRDGEALTFSCPPGSNPGGGVGVYLSAVQKREGKKGKRKITCQKWASIEQRSLRNPA